MTPKRPLSRVSKLPQQTSSISLLESLSESRITVLFLARQAKESKDNALAKQLTEKGRSFKIEMARIRRIATADWTKETVALLKRSKTAHSELAKLIQDTDKSTKKIRVFTRALNAVSNILAVAKKVI